MKSIYFMDFIKDNFKDLQILEKVFTKNLYRRGYSVGPNININKDNFKNVFEMVYKNDKSIDKLSEVFSTYIVWSESYIELGFSTSIDLSKVHYEWQSIVFTNVAEDILFEKVNYVPLQIKFEGD